MLFVAINNALLSQSRFLEQSGLKLLTRLLVGIPRDAPHNAVPTPILDVPLP